MMEISSKEMMNTIATTIERVYEEMGSQISRVNAQDKALVLVRQIRYGVGGEIQYIPAKIREHEQKIPLCRKCK